MIDPNGYLVEIFRLNATKRWELFTYEGAKTTVEFTSIDWQCSLSELYEDVRMA